MTRNRIHYLLFHLCFLTDYQFHHKSSVWFHGCIFPRRRHLRKSRITSINISQFGSFSYIPNHYSSLKRRQKKMRHRSIPKGRTDAARAVIHRVRIVHVSVLRRTVHMCSLRGVGTYAMEQGRYLPYYIRLHCSHLVLSHSL